MVDSAQNTNELTNFSSYPLPSSSSSSFVLSSAEMMDGFSVLGLFSSCLYVFIHLFVCLLLCFLYCKVLCNFFIFLKLCQHVLLASLLICLKNYVSFYNGPNYASKSFCAELRLGLGFCAYSGLPQGQFKPHSALLWNRG